MATIPSKSSTRRHARLGTAAVAVAGLGFAVAGGLPGIAAAVALAGSWYALPTPYAVAVGHLLLAVLLPEDPGLLALVLAELGLLGVLAAAAPLRDETLSFAGRLVGCGVPLSAVAAIGFLVGGLPAAALSLVAAALALGYGLHRYELLRLGLLDEPTGTATDP